MFVEMNFYNEILKQINDLIMKGKYRFNNNIFK